MFEMLGLYEDSLVQYDELDALFTQFVLNHAAGGKCVDLAEMSSFLCLHCLSFKEFFRKLDGNLYLLWLLDLVEWRVTYYVATVRRSVRIPMVALPNDKSQMSSLGRHRSCSMADEFPRHPVQLLGRTVPLPANQHRETTAHQEESPVFAGFQELLVLSAVHAAFSAAATLRSSTEVDSFHAQLYEWTGYFTGTGNRQIWPYHVYFLMINIDGKAS